MHSWAYSRVCGKSSYIPYCPRPLNVDGNSGILLMDSPGFRRNNLLSNLDLQPTVQVSNIMWTISTSRGMSLLHVLPMASQIHFNSRNQVYRLLNLFFFSTDKEDFSNYWACGIEKPNLSTVKTCFLWTWFINSINLVYRLINLV